jgi:hypothetical protein
MLSEKGLFQKFYFYVQNYTERKDFKFNGDLSNDQTGIKCYKFWAQKNFERLRKFVSGYVWKRDFFFWANFA